MLLLAYFHIGFPSFSAARAFSPLSWHIYKDNTHLKTILNIPFEISGESAAKLHGPVLCKLTLPVCFLVNATAMRYNKRGKDIIQNKKERYCMKHL